MIRADDLIEKFRQALDEGWGYIWGKAGQTWTEAMQKNATNDMAIKYGKKWIGKRVADCSGLFVWAFRELGGSIYHGSNTIWNRYTTNKGKVAPSVSLRPGTAMFLKRESDGNRHHIGLYVGNDTVIEAKGTMYGVVTSRVDHWDEWGELAGVSYGNEAEEVKTNMDTVRKGSSGEAVKQLQDTLNELGYKLEADGKFGTMTLGAVVTFQTAHELDPDGVVGEKTWNALKTALEEAAMPTMGDEVSGEATNPDQHNASGLLEDDDEPEELAQLRAENKLLKTRLSAVDGVLADIEENLERLKYALQRGMEE